MAIPAFVSRAFRHNGIYVSPASGISAPADLTGRVAGVAEYQLTANVWIRGILAERYGVPVAAVRYRTGGLHEPGRAFVRYAWEQGLFRTQPAPEALFAAETHEAYVI